MDIQQPLSAEAALTLGKDMSFRDYAQGAFRMRGIGKGQKIRLVIIPEVAKMIRTQVRTCKVLRFGTPSPPIWTCPGPA
jgi:hypothetical protein